MRKLEMDIGHPTDNAQFWPFAFHYFFVTDTAIMTKWDFIRMKEIYSRSINIPAR